MSFPENITTVPVTGRLLAGTVDGPKPTTGRQAVSARFLVEFTPEILKVPAPGAAGGPTTFYRAGLPATVRAVVDADGYLCTPDPDNFKIPMFRGVRLIATDDPALAVTNWTWRVTISTIEGRQVEAYSIAVPASAATNGLDLTLLAPVPSSPGYGLPQAEAAAAAAATSAAATISGGTITGDNLILTRRNGETVNAGNVRGPKGDSIKGDKGDPGAQGLPGTGAVPADEAVAGYINTTGTSATKAALGTFMRYRGTLPNGADLNTLTESTDNGLWLLASANTYVNAPFAGAGMLTVTNTGIAGAQTVRRYNSRETHERSIQSYSSKTWLGWSRLDRVITTVASGTDVDTLRTEGDYIVTSNAVAATLLNAPPNAGPAKIRVEAGATGLINQEWKPLYSSTGAGPYARYTSSLGTTPYPFGAWKDLSAVAGAAPATTSTEAGLANTVLVQDFSRRYGGRIKTGGKGAVAFRFDHGLANYKSLLKPLMDARGFKHYRC